MEPARQGGVATELSDALKGADERVLCPFLCEIGTPAHPEDEAIHAVDVPVVELAVRRPVGCPQSRDQIGVGHGLQPVDAEDRFVPVTVCACMCTPKDSSTPAV